MLESSLQGVFDEAILLRLAVRQHHLMNPRDVLMPLFGGASLHRLLLKKNSSLNINTHDQHHPNHPNTIFATLFPILLPNATPIPLHPKPTVM